MKLSHLLGTIIVSALSSDATQRGWTVWGGSCYAVLDTYSKWDDALAACRAHGGSLASIADAEENAVAVGVCGDRTCWLGLRERPHEQGSNSLFQRRDFYWVDGSGDLGEWNNWLPGEPNNHEGRDEEYGIMNLPDCCCTDRSRSPGVFGDCCRAGGAWYDTTGVIGWQGWQGGIVHALCEVTECNPADLADVAGLGQQKTCPLYCHEWGWPEEGKWNVDTDCCAGKQEMACADGHGLESSDDVCHEEGDFKAYSYECVPCDADDASCQGNLAVPICHRWGYPEGGKWNADIYCCAGKQEMACADGHRLESSDDVCYEEGDLKEYSYDCIPCDADDASCQGNIAVANEDAVVSSGICPQSSTFEVQYFAGARCMEGPIFVGESNLGFTVEECSDAGGDWVPYDCSVVRMFWEQFGGWVDSLAVMQPIFTSKCCRGAPSFAETVTEDACPEPCGEGSFCVGAAGCMDCVENEVYHPRACSGLVVSGLPTAVAATVTACRASCPDQTHALATEVPCGGSRGPCGTSPDGSPRYCDYQIGADAGGYCVDCLWKTSASSSLAQKDATDKCTLNNCPEPCGEGSLCFNALCVTCIALGILHPSHCHALSGVPISQKECAESCTPVTCHGRSDCVTPGIGGLLLTNNPGTLFCNVLNSNHVDGSHEWMGTCEQCPDLASMEECGALNVTSVYLHECTEVCKAATTSCSTNEDCTSGMVNGFCNDISNSCKQCPGEESGRAPHCGVATVDDTSLMNCDISCNTKCCNTNTNECYMGSLDDGDENTVCERGCSDRLPCPSSSMALYCDYHQVEYGTCRECAPNKEKREEECFFSGLPLQAATDCAETCQSTLATSNCKFCGEGISGSSLKSAQEGEPLCNFCPDGLKKANFERIIPFLGDDTTCFKMNQFFLSYKIAEEDPNCRLARNFNYICGCEGSGYAGADSQAKKTALVWAPRMSGLLSFFCSFIIIVHILRDPSRRRKINGQLMVTMSVFDLIGSAAYAFTSFPIPSEYLIWGSRGNAHSCNAQGFFIQIGTTAAFVNVSLAVYYYCVCALGWTQTRIKEMRHWLFICPIVAGFSLAIAGLGLDSYSMLFTWCNNSAHLMSEIPIIVAITFVTAIMGALCWDVYKTEKRAQQYVVGATSNSMSSAVFQQAMWYLLSFYLTWPPYLALQICWMTGSAYSNYPLIVCACTLVPLQGFWNSIGYFRKRTSINLSQTMANIMGSITQLLPSFQSTQSTAMPKSRASRAEVSATAPTAVKTNDAADPGETHDKTLDPENNSISDIWMPQDQGGRGVTESA